MRVYMYLYLYLRNNNDTDLCMYLYVSIPHHYRPTLQVSTAPPQQRQRLTYVLLCIHPIPHYRPTLPSHITGVQHLPQGAEVLHADPGSPRRARVELPPPAPRVQRLLGELPVAQL